MTAEWKMILAKDEAEFESIWTEMKDQAYAIFKAPKHQGIEASLTQYFSISFHRLDVLHIQAAAQTQWDAVQYIFYAGLGYGVELLIMAEVGAVNGNRLQRAVQFF